MQKVNIHEYLRSIYVRLYSGRSHLYSCLSVQGTEVSPESGHAVAGRRHAKGRAGGGEEGGREVDRGSSHGVSTVNGRQLHQRVWVGVANEDHVTKIKG